MRENVKPKRTSKRNRFKAWGLVKLVPGAGKRKVGAKTSV